ncbi:MAG TPA: DnaJ domain-containing protein [Kofleriaceae bacterium]|nr:DnaJ domain-containing protein [Kofleriaceae bacterium]
MADGGLSIRLRCASWQQLATIYRRDLSRGTMFLRAATPPPIGAPVHITLALPSATVIELTGVVHSHVDDPERGNGVELQLAPLPASSVWLIESALGSEHRRLATPAHGVPVIVPNQISGTVPAIGDAAELTAAERDLIKALVSEAESLRKLNPFLVLGLGYEATDAEVRAAFGELTKRYHPDRFARYESTELRQVAAEIFILIRDAYRKLADAGSRAQVLQSLGKSMSGPRAVAVPPRVPQAVPPARPIQRVPAATTGQRRAIGEPTGTAPAAAPPPEPIDTTALEELVDRGELDDALAAYRLLFKKHPHDRNVRAGIDLCEGLRALAVRDRLEAAQRFEAALEIDPSNERAARELADMRRQATNERKGLLSRLMGKKEP